jgi:nucleoside-diphosphate-sugar epimerase
MIYTSSISIYGDRRDDPFIKVSDCPNPNKDDTYAKQKLLCEDIIKRSNISRSIFRLSYIVSPGKIDLDPLMFEMPLETCIEVCHTKDVGLALVNALDNPNIWGNTYNIAGGPKCRIVYRDYLHRMLDIFGLNGNLLPPSAFSSDEFHCGFMDTEESQNLLKYQEHTLEDYFEEVKKEVKSMRIINKLFPLINRPIAKKRLLNNSPYYSA